MIAVTILFGIMVLVLSLIIVAHLVARKDDNEFSANRPSFGNHDAPLFGGGLDTWRTTTTTVTWSESPRKKSKAKVGKPTLKEQLEAALADEKYEEAAKIRDEMKKEKNK